MNRNIDINSMFQNCLICLHLPTICLHLCGIIGSCAELQAKLQAVRSSIVLRVKGLITFYYQSAFKNSNKQGNMILRCRDHAQLLKVRRFACVDVQALNQIPKKYRLNFSLAPGVGYVSFWNEPI